MEDRLPQVMEMAGYFQSLIADRRGGGGDDLISQVINAEVDGESLSDEDIVGFNMLLLIAGNETTTNLLANLLHYLADQPEVWQQLRQQPELIDPAIEEILRFDAPVQWVSRKATDDVELHGVQIKAGDFVQLLCGSANRDENHYEDADSFRLDRGRGDHHSFGHGIHFCIGAPLARMEARYALTGLLKRYKGFRHAENASNQRTYSAMLRGFHHLWLEFDPA
jgi:cytochrome P450